MLSTKSTNQKTGKFLLELSSQMIKLNKKTIMKVFINKNLDPLAATHCKNLS
jgi:hypothetical protein